MEIIVSLPYNENINGELYAILVCVICFFDHNIYRRAITALKQRGYAKPNVFSVSICFVIARLIKWSRQHGHARNVCARLRNI